MKYLSVCSGIEAATCAWHPLGWEPFAFSEIEKFPSQVLAHHYPNVPNLGDMTKFEEWPSATIDLLVGGTPCQSFSVAGLRKGLADPRGNLMLTYGAIARRYRPKWLVWENVPGVLSSNGGRDFGTFLGMLGQLGYGFAYRILDAQYFGVAQRRRRVFVVGCLGNWRSAAAVLFERHSMQGNPAPSREAGEKIAPTIRAGASNGGAGHGARSGDSKDELIIPHVTGTLNANGKAAGSATQQDAECGMLVTHAMLGEGFDASEDGTGRGTPLVPCVSPTLDQRAGRSGANSFATSGGLIPVPHADISPAIKARDSKGVSSDGDGDGAILVPMHAVLPFDSTQITSPENRANPQYGDPCHPLQAKAHVPAIAFPGRMSGTQCASSEEVAPSMCSVNPTAVAFNMHKSGNDASSMGVSEERTDCLRAFEKSPFAVQPSAGMLVRRLTPMECERLQGFRDNYTQLPGHKEDGPRYKALGNSMAVPCMRWIGMRIEQQMKVA